MAQSTNDVPDDDRSLPGRGYPRLLQLLELVAESDEPRTVGEIAAQLEMPKSTAWVLVQHCLARGYLLAHRDDRAFVAGPALFRLATAALHRNPLRHLARPMLEALRARTGANVYLAVRSGDDAVFLDRLEGSSMLQISAPLTERRPLHCTAAGKVLLAFSADGLFDRFVAATPMLVAATRNTITEPAALTREVRRTARRGYAVSDGEWYEGVLSIAAPVLAADHTLVAAVVASDYAPTMRANLDDRVAAVLATAAAVATAWNEPPGATGAGSAAARLGS